MNTQKVYAFNIRWDIDGEDDEAAETLPSKVEIEIQMEMGDEGDLEELISDELTNTFGFCHIGFDYYLID